MFRQGCHHQAPGTTTGTTSAAAMGWGWGSPLPLTRQPPTQGDELSIGEKAPLRGNQKKVARWHIPDGGAIRPRHLAYPDGGVIRPRYSNTLVFNVKNRGDITPREREPAMATACNWRNLRGTRGTVHVLLKVRRSNSHYGGVINDPAAE